MCFRLSWTTIRAIQDLSKKIFLLCSSEFFLVQGPILVMPYSLRLFESFGFYQSLIKSKVFTFVRESVSYFWEEEGSHPLTVPPDTPLPAPSPQAPPRSCSSTNITGLLNVSSPFAGLSGGCNISDSLHGAPGAAHPLWMGALLDFGQPLPEPFCSQPSLPGLPVSDTTLYLQHRESVAAWVWHEPPWKAELLAVICLLILQLKEK